MALSKSRIAGPPKPLKNPARFARQKLYILLVLQAFKVIPVQKNGRPAAGQETPDPSSHRPPRIGGSPAF